MKQNLSGDVNANINHHHNIDIPTQDVEGVIDKITNSALTIIAALTVSSVVKSLFNHKKPF